MSISQHGMVKYYFGRIAPQIEILAKLQVWDYFLRNIVAINEERSAGNGPCIYAI